MAQHAFSMKKGPLAEQNTAASMTVVLCEVAKSYIAPPKILRLAMPGFRAERSKKPRVKTGGRQPLDVSEESDFISKNCL